MAGSPYTIAHNLGAAYPLVELWDAVNGQMLTANAAVVDANHVTITFTSNPPHDVTVVVTGGATGAVGFRWVQVSAATTWTINHNLGYYPNVSVVDSTRTQIFPGDVKYIDTANVQLDFSASVGGEAYLS